ncbi:MAG: peptidase T, partial [Gemmataceae bacterium]|nr:peptidase T [Gemmataceae bacterium]
FCRYVQIDTQAIDGATTYPSSPGQLELGRMLVEELRALGLHDVEQSPHGIVMATIPARGCPNAPTIAWLAHLDTSPETSGRAVKPIIHRHYDGNDIVLPGDPRQVIRVSENPDLAVRSGQTIITSDGTTLLGADDKAGVAVVMEAAQRLYTESDRLHGPIRLCFTCDEEIGRGVDFVDLEKLSALVAYTLDGAGVGEIETETFSADKATVTITGVNIHPSIAKGRMVNAVRLAAMFVDRLPRQALSPETTEKREGFIHPISIEGGVGQTVIRLLLRDHDTPKLNEQAELLRQIARQLEWEFPRARISVEIEKQYRNMADGLRREPRAVALAEQAVRRAGLTPVFPVLRGGTDGARLTELGLPTPNLSTGEHNPHSPLEWTSLEDMESAVAVLLNLAELWGRERV